MKVQLLLILSVWSCAEWSRVDGQMIGSPRFLPGLNHNRFNNHQMLPQRPLRTPPPMNRPPQPEREPQSSHPTSGKEFRISAISAICNLFTTSEPPKIFELSKEVFFYI